MIDPTEISIELFKPVDVRATPENKVLFLAGSNEEITGWRKSALNLLLPDLDPTMHDAVMPLFATGDVEIEAWNSDHFSMARQDGVQVLWYEEEGLEPEEIIKQRKRLELYIQLQEAAGNGLVIGAEASHSLSDLLKYLDKPGVFTADSLEGLIDGIGQGLLFEAEEIRTGIPSGPLMMRVESTAEINPQLLAYQRTREYLSHIFQIVSDSGKYSKYNCLANGVDSFNLHPKRNEPTEIKRFRKNKYNNIKVYYIERLNYATDHGHEVFLRGRMPSDRSKIYIDQMPDNSGSHYSDDYETLASISLEGDHLVEINGEPASLEDTVDLMNILLKSTLKKKGKRTKKMQEYERLVALIPGVDVSADGTEETGE